MKKVGSLAVLALLAIGVTGSAFAQQQRFPVPAAVDVAFQVADAGTLAVIQSGTLPFTITSEIARAARLNPTPAGFSQSQLESIVASQFGRRNFDPPFAANQRGAMTRSVGGATQQLFILGVIPR